MNETTKATIKAQFERFRKEFDSLTKCLKDANLFVRADVDGAHDVINGGILDFEEVLEDLGIGMERE